MMILYENEPFEVCILKKQLANLTCKCSVCDKLNIPDSCRGESIVSMGIDKEVQSGPMLKTPEQNCKHVNTFDPNFDLLCNSVSCAGCYIALNLLKAREPRVCKDEETGTTLGISCDKSSGKCIQFVETTTSTSSIKTVQNSITSLREKFTNIETLNGIMKKRSNEHVTFSEYFDHDEPNEVQPFYDQCFCLQNFIDSIRPPLNNR